MAEPNLGKQLDRGSTSIVVAAPASSLLAGGCFAEHLRTAASVKGLDSTPFNIRRQVTSPRRRHRLLGRVRATYQVRGVARPHAGHTASLPVQSKGSADQIDQLTARRAAEGHRD